MSSPSRVLVVSCLVATFIAGAVSGGFIKANWDTKPGKPPQFTAEAMTRKMCDRFSNELGLSRDQQAAFEKIIHEESVKIEEAHKRMGSEVHSLFHEMDAKLMALLTLEQKEKFLEMKRQRNRRMEHPDSDKDRKFSGPPGGPPPGEPPSGGPPPQ